MSTEFNKYDLSKLGVSIYFIQLSYIALSTALVTVWSMSMGPYIHIYQNTPNFAQNVTLSPDSPAQCPDQPWHTLVLGSLPHLNSPLPLMVNLKLKFLSLMLILTLVTAAPP